MCHKKRIFFSSALTLLLMSSVIDARHQHCLKRSVKIVGVVVAYNQLASLVNITDAPQHQFLLVRVDKSVSGERYLKIIYKYGVNESLPDEVFDGKSKWRFNLTRDCGCDGSPKRNESKTEGEIAVATWKETIEGADVPLDAKLLCYALRPKGFKRVSSSAAP